MIFRSLRPLIVLLTASAALHAADFVWMEAEDLTKSNVGAAGSVWNKPELLSGGKVIQFAIAPQEATAKVPAEGILLSYEMEAPLEGAYELWNRVGFEGVRAPFDWRVNGGEWVSNAQKTHRTIDVVETAFWNPIGWSRLGTANLKAGKNTLEIRINKVTKKTGDKEEPAQLLYVSDAFVFSKGPWIPNHREKPGDGWMGEQDKSAAAQVFKRFFVKKRGVLLEAEGKRGGCKIQSFSTRHSGYRHRGLCVA